MKYQPPFGAMDPNASYVDRNTAGAVAGSKVSAAALEHHQRELVTLITNSGLAASANDLTQVSRAIRSGRLIYAPAEGTANALTVVLTPSPANYGELRYLIVVPSLANVAGEATLSVNGLTALSLKYRGEKTLPAGMLMAGVPVGLALDGTSAHILGVIGLASAADLTAGVNLTMAATPGRLAPTVQAGAWTYATAGGAANALTATFVPAIGAHVVGMEIRLKISTANTGAATLNVGPGALPIVTARGEPIEADDLIPNLVVTLICTGTSWMILGWTFTEISPARAVQQYNAAGTYTFVAARRGWFWVEVYGGGGGGGCDPAAGAAGEGGGGGGYAGRWVFLQRAASVPVIAGAAGANNGGGTGTAGGTSSFGAYCSATGGLPGTASGGAGAGGSGAGGEINLSGGWGSSGNAADYVGRGGDCAGPHGGKGSLGTDGVPATWPGGGGNVTKHAGGVYGSPAAAGGVIIKW